MLMLMLGGEVLVAGLGVGEVEVGCSIARLQGRCAAKVAGGEVGGSYCLTRSLAVD